MKKLMSTILATTLAISIFGSSYHPVQAAATQESSQETQVQAEALNLGTIISFIDMMKHWAKEAVQFVVNRGIVQGYPDGTFRPESNVTRAEFAAMLSRAIDKDVPAVTEPFTDVSDTFWGKAEIERGIALGFINPKDYSNNKFEPNKPMTRAELSKWMGNGLSAVNSQYGSVISTLANSSSTLIPIPEFYKGGVSKTDLPYIGLVMGTGIMTGYDDFTFRPSGKTTRAEVATILQRLDKVMKQDPASFKGLNELVEVAKTGTNLITLTKYEYGKGEELTRVLNKPITFRGKVGVGKLHRLIVIEGAGKGTSIYHNMFYDKKMTTNNKIYHSFSEVSYTANKDMGSSDPAVSIPTSFIFGSHFYDYNPMVNFGVTTLNPYMKTSTDYFFRKGVTKRFWVTNAFTKELSSDEPFTWYQIKTDDGSTSALMLKR